MCCFIFSSASIKILSSYTLLKPSSLLYSIDTHTHTHTHTLSLCLSLLCAFTSSIHCASLISSLGSRDEKTLG